MESGRAQVGSRERAVQASVENPKDQLAGHMGWPVAAEGNQSHIVTAGYALKDLM